jgi:TRAP-type uncharacterized transport system fused permease subunit
MAAATICHGDPYRTVIATLRYTLPAFLVPLAFTMRPDGLGLLLQAPWPAILSSGLFATAIVVAAAAAASGFLFRKLTFFHRAVFGAAGVALLAATGFLQYAAVVAVAGAIGRAAMSRRTSDLQ